MAQGIVVLEVDHEDETLVILHADSPAQVIAIVASHLLPTLGQYGLHRSQTVAEVCEEGVQQTQVTIHLALQAELAKRGLEVVGHLRHAHRLVLERANAANLLRRRTTMIHVVADAVGTTAQCAHHQTFSSLGRYDGTTGVDHLDAGSHLCTERGIVLWVIARGGIVSLPRQVLE